MTKRKTTIVIRRVEAAGGGHHGGAWKVAYADFVTAMMAFFLVMWLINATTEKQRRGLADYFSSQIGQTKGASGSGKPFGGLTPYETGSLVSNRGAVNLNETTGANAVSGPGTAARGGPAANVGDLPHQDTAPDPDAQPVMGDSDKPRMPSGTGDDTSNGNGSGDDVGSEAAAQAAKAKAEAAAATAEQQHLTDAAANLEHSLASDPDLAEIASQIKVELQPDGLHILITDSNHQPMFAPGADQPNVRARLLFSQVAPVLANLNEPISIAGHTDGATCVGACRSNWSLSAARAEATRVELEHDGLGDARIANVMGYADRDLLMPADPLNAANRRIVLVVHRRYAFPIQVAAQAAAVH